MTDGIESFRFNTSVARLYELTNTIAAFKPAARSIEGRSDWIWYSLVSAGQLSGLI